MDVRDEGEGGIKNEFLVSDFDFYNWLSGDALPWDRHLDEDHFAGGRL